MFELKRESVSHWLRLANGDELIATFRWPKPVELRELYRKAPTRWKSVGSRETEAVDPDETPYIEMMEKTLTGLENANGEAVSGTIEEQKQIIKSLNAFSIRLVTGCLLNIRALNAERGSGLASLMARTIPISTTEWVNGEAVEHRLTHQLAEINSPQQKQISAAIRVINKRGTGEQYEDALPITNVYKAVIRSIDGASVEGEPCTEENKEKWVDLVPYHWISVVIGESQRTIEAVNFR